MLPYVRFVLGAVLALAVLGAASLGLFASLRLAQQAKVGPLESSRNTPFDDRADWNQFNDPEAARRFEELTRKAALSDAAAERAAQDRAAHHEVGVAVDRDGVPYFPTFPSADLFSAELAPLAFSADWSDYTFLDS